ncbi:MAG: helix-turn-helix domain-containing protein [Kiritimatiellia bacterium]
MTKLSPNVCFSIRDARRAAKLSQSVLAAEVGCKQSALSMFEQGDGTKLNDEVVGKLAQRFGIALTESAAEASASAGAAVVGYGPGHGFCPNAHCPSNRRYEVEGRAFMLPDRMRADPVGGKFCALCGEVLERRCPNCGASVHEGAVCSLCGEAYVAVV